MYCAVVLDVFIRRVVGWSIDSRPEASLGMAIERGGSLCPLALIGGLASSDSFYERCGTPRYPLAPGAPGYFAPQTRRSDALSSVWWHDLEPPSLTNR